MGHAPLTKERELWSAGYKAIGGIDEAGRGPLAGPVVAACVIMPEDRSFDGIYDSKKLTPKRRETIYNIIKQEACAIGIGRVDAKIIDEINILNATRKAMELAVKSCKIKPDYLLVDAMELHNIYIPQISIVKGDILSQSIAAASIVAKVVRDREMMYWHRIYPQYGFDRHKGYGTKAHINAIGKYGMCPIHRNSFSQKFVKR